MNMLLAQYVMQPETLLAQDARERRSWVRRAGTPKAHRIRWSMPRLALRPAAHAPAPCC